MLLSQYFIYHFLYNLTVIFAKQMIAYINDLTATVPLLLVT